MVNLVDLMLMLDDWGLTDVLLPFILVFAITFSILKRMTTLGSNNAVNVTIAVVVATLFVMPHITGYYSEYDPVAIVNASLPVVAVIILSIIMVLVINGAFGGDGTTFTGYPKWIAWFSIIVVVYIFGYNAGWWYGNLPDWLWWLDSDLLFSTLIVIGTITGIVYYINRGSS